MFIIRHGSTGFNHEIELPIQIPCSAPLTEQLKRSGSRSEGAEGEPGKGGRAERAGGGGRHVAARSKERDEEGQGCMLLHHLVETKGSGVK